MNGAARRRSIEAPRPEPLVLQLVGHGTVLASRAWRAELGGTLRRALEAPQARMAKQGSAPLSASLAWVPDTDAGPRDVDAALEQFLSEFARRQPRLTVSAREDLWTFTGALARTVLVSFEPMPGLRAQQRHVLLPGPCERLHHLVGTMPAGKNMLLDQEIQRICTSYEPLPEERL